MKLPVINSKTTIALGLLIIYVYKVLDYKHAKFYICFLLL